MSVNHKPQKSVVFGETDGKTRTYQDKDLGMGMENGNKHTPGPWAYRPAEGDDWGIVRAPVTEQGQWAGGIICQARDPEALDQLTLARHRESKTDPWEANARLIAAAPELLSALQFLADQARATPGFGTRLALIEADRLLARLTPAPHCEQE